MWRGINFGGALDGGRDWMAERHFDVVRDGGFDMVRLPVQWHGADVERVDWAIGCALGRDLDVVLDVHHYHELSADVDRHRDRFLALWSRIGERYAGADPRLSFELLNEPHEPMTAAVWNELLAAALEVVRASNPERRVLAGPVRWNTIDGLAELRLPDDPNLTVTIHYYSPFPFTHQGAEWLEGADRWLGTAWDAERGRAGVRADLERAATWARDRGRPLFLGEFGVVDRASTDDRAAWTALVRSEAERLGMGWAYWDFATDFGAFDLDRSEWQAPLRRALLP